MAVQGLGFHVFTVEGLDSIPARGTEILQDAWHGPKKKKKKKEKRNLGIFQATNSAIGYF